MSLPFVQVRHFIPRNNGFTLIELSIVLVIIGLIVGGVLVGRDLIKAAEIRATVGQYEKYNATVNTFRTKYGGIPGDLQNGTNSKVSAFGFCLSSGCLSGEAGFGDENGVLQEGGAANARRAWGEILTFWQQLSAANLVEGNFGTDLSVNGAVPANTTIATVGNYVPPAKMGRGVHWNVGSASGTNYYMLSGYGSTPINSASGVTFDEIITPIEAFNIDSKIDNGMPNTGTVQVRGTVTYASGLLYEELDTTTVGIWSTATPASAVAGDCMTTGASATDTANTYARTGTAGNAGGCILRLRFN